MKPEYERELVESGEAFLAAVFAHLRLVADDGSAIFTEGARFEKALGAARTGRRRSYGTPRAQRKANA